MGTWKKSAGKFIRLVQKMGFRNLIGRKEDKEKKEANGNPSIKKVSKTEEEVLRRVLEIITNLCPK